VGNFIDNFFFYTELGRWLRGYGESKGIDGDVSVCKDVTKILEENMPLKLARQQRNEPEV